MAADLDVPLFCKGCTRMIIVPWNEGDSPDTSGRPSWSFIEGRRLGLREPRGA